MIAVGMRDGSLAAVFKALNITDVKLGLTLIYMALENETTDLAKLIQGYVGSGSLIEARAQRFESESAADLSLAALMQENYAKLQSLLKPAVSTGNIREAVL